MLQIAPGIVGGLLVLESFLMLIVGAFVVIVVILLGPLAFLPSDGSAATGGQLLRGPAVLAITLASPFVVAAVLWVGGVLLMLRKRMRVVIAVGVCVIMAQIVFHVHFWEPFQPVELIPFAVHVSAIAVAFARMPTSVASTTPS